MRRINTHNDAFFDTMDTEAKAYWLGFLAADAYICPDRPMFVVGLCADDERHLSRLKRDLGSSATIAHYTSTLGTPFVSMAVTSPRLIVNLKRLGVTHGKHTRRIPILPPHLLHHYIRGIFDGDGSIANNTSGKYNKGQAHFSICGWPAMIEECQRILMDAASLNQTRLMVKGRSVSLCYMGNRQVGRIADWLYADAHRYLARKRHVFTQLCGPVGDVGAGIRNRKM